jgi:hypothetical protein
MSDTIIGAFIGVGGVILGVLIAGPLTNYYSKRLIEQTHKNALEALRIAEFNKAAAAFYEAFHETLMDIENQNLTTTDTDSLVKKNIEKQIAAVQRFKFHLSKTERIAFLDTWEAYEHDCHAAKFTDMGFTDRTKREKAHNLALHRLYSILKFADYERAENAAQPENQPDAD